MTERTQDVIQDKHWKHTIYGGTIESHTEFLLSGYKRAYGMNPSKKALMNHIKRLSEEIERTKNND